MNWNEEAIIIQSYDEITLSFYLRFFGVFNVIFFYIDQKCFLKMFIKLSPRVSTIFETKMKVVIGTNILKHFVKCEMKVNYNDILV